MNGIKTEEDKTEVIEKEHESDGERRSPEKKSSSRYVSTLIDRWRNGDMVSYYRTPNKGHVNWAPSHLKRFRNKGILEDRQKAGQSTNRELSQKTPSVYQYDEIYYKMEREKIETKRCQEGAGIGSGCKKPKYIGKLLATAVKRKRETERRIERQGKKEREEEEKLKTNLTNQPQGRKNITRNKDNNTSDKKITQVALPSNFWREENRHGGSAIYVKEEVQCQERVY
ncbi:hypothetical protein NQ317_018284 [Molorchus minor]|uniref:Nuclear speckle splicing regulatory protein 1 N-terminal domain-containing protein n=1 Tax=Molorchus minor TaxID=1323400 RepID=A0ABQ9K5X4_9CUCU|nr:hypothetical protein NQ317_018284 [Molorchus minor]